MANWANIMGGAAQGLDQLKVEQQQEAATRAGAQMFAQLGSQEAIGYAQLMQSDPDTAAMMAKQFGGMSGLYQSMRQNVQYSAALGAQGASNRAAGRALGPQYEDAAAAGVDPMKLARAKQAAAAADVAPASEYAKIMKDFEIERGQFTGDSERAFVESVQGGDPDTGLLQMTPEWRSKMMGAGRRAGTDAKPGAVRGKVAVQDGVDEGGNPVWEYQDVKGAPPSSASEQEYATKQALAAKLEQHPEYMDQDSPAFDTGAARLFRVAYFRAFGIKSQRDQSAIYREYTGLSKGDQPAGSAP
ncbi:MAG TPA: hypothetical protein VM285_01875 [Polyangia bacterium]|nr:hypothetical protein [Polyangia bacterium]